MAVTRLIFYQESQGHSSIVDWLLELRKTQPRAYAKCLVRIRRLAEMGYELRRPEADFLRDGIYELRARWGTVNYRLLYFFHGRNIAILAHAITKEGSVPEAEINQALSRKYAFQQNPEAHVFSGEIIL